MSSPHLEYFGKANKIDEGSRFAWLFGQLAPWYETTYPAILPQVIFAVLLVVTLQLVKEWRGEFEIPAGLSSFHDLLGTFLGLVFGMSIGNALGNYNGATSALFGIKGQLRIVLNNSATFAVTPGTDMKEVSALREKIRIKCNTIFLFMRQRMRESRLGFHPATDMKWVPFNNETFTQDPCLPRADTLITTPEEKAYYASIPVNERPIAVECELQQLASALGRHLVSPGEYVSGTHDAINGAMGNLTVCMTIINGGALPFMYVHMLKTFTLLFVYVTPVLYVHGDLDFSKFCATLIICIGYYSINTVANRMVDPFGWNKSDVNPEVFGMAIDSAGKGIMQGL